MFHSSRYEMAHSSHWFDHELALTSPQRELDALTRFDNSTTSPRLLELARLAARKRIPPEQSQEAFDLR